MSLLLFLLERKEATLSLKLDVVAVGSTVELVVGVVVLLEGLLGELLTRGSKFVLAGLIVVEQPTAMRRNSADRPSQAVESVK